MTYSYLRPSQVTLDPDNPRLPDGTSSDREAINRLLDEGADALINLARDMAKSGQTNPAELPIAIKEGSKYRILEGNRRFAALKLLGDPTLAYDEAHRNVFRRAAALGTPPRSVFTLVSTSREEADHWIVLRHTGENEGRGVRRWSAGQTATHRRRANKSVDSGTIRSITIADELEEAYAADEEIIELVRKARREKLTNIGRFFSPDVLERLHFSIQVDDASALRERTLLVRHSRADLRDFFAWAFAYILENSVDAYKNRDIRREALLSVPQLLPQDADASAQPFRLAEVPPEDEEEDEDSSDGSSYGAGTDTGANTGAGSSSGQQGSNSTEGQGGANGGATRNTNGQRSGSARNKTEAKPEKYLLQGLRLPNHPSRVQRLLKECRQLELDQMSSVACVMLRVLVELVLSSPQALALSQGQEADSLKKKIVGMLKFLDPDIENARKRDKALEQAFLDASELGIEYLNGFVHNPSLIPDPHLARRFSAGFRPLLERVDGIL